MVKVDVTTTIEKGLARKMSVTNKDYIEYLKSNEWRSKARERLKIDEFKCCMCGSCGTPTNPLQIHHLTYRRIRYENTYTDLMTLCKSCHLNLHRAMNRKTSPSNNGWRDELSYTEHINRQLEQMALYNEKQYAERDFD